MIGENLVVSGKDFVELLKKLDIKNSLKSESFDWLFEKEQTKYILTWMCKNLNESNILTDHELVLSGKVDDLISDDRCEQVNNDHPGVFHVTFNQVETLEKQLIQEQKKEESLKKLSNNYLSLDTRIKKQVKRLEEKCMKLQSEIKIKKEHLKKGSMQIDSAHKDIIKNSSIISNTIANFNNPVLLSRNFVSQMNLNELKSLDEENKAYLNLWIEKRLGLNDVLDIMTPSKATTNNNLKITLSADYQRINQSLVNSIVDCIKCECANEEIKTTKHYLDNKNIALTSNHLEQSVKEIQLKQNINGYIQEYSILIAELEQVVNKYVAALIDKSLSKGANEKYHNTCKLLNRIKMLDSFLLQQFCVNNLLNFLYQTEKHQLKTTLKALTQAEQYLINQTQRNHQQNLIMAEMEEDYQKYEETDLIKRENIISDYLKVDSDLKTINNINQLLSVVQRNDALLNTLINSKNDDLESPKFMDKIKMQDSVIKNVKKVIWSGPTLEPSIIPYRYLESMYQLEHYLEKNKENFNRASKSYKELQNYLNVKWNKERKLLPVWFLSEPKKMLMVIDKIEKYVVSKSQRDGATVVTVPEGKLLEL